MSLNQNSARGANNSAHIFTVAEVAAMLELKAQPNGKWHGAPDGTGKTKDGFVLCPEGNAFTNDGTRYKSREVAELAGISPDQYAPCVEYRARNGAPAQSRPTVPKPAPKAPKSPANAAPFDWEGATIYLYTDESGITLFEVGRTGDGPTKRISQRKPKKGGGYDYKLEDARRVLYHLPEVLAAQFVFICEGEKAADAVNTALDAAGLLSEYIATTNPHGAGKWRDEYAEVLEGKTVCVLPDNDKPGADHADGVCLSCSSAGAAVKRVELPELSEKGDAADFFANGGTVEKLVELFKVAPKWNPTPARRFPRVTLSEIFTRPRLEYLIDGIFIEKGTGVISANYGSFKSFVALDMALCVATGRPWMGREVKRGSVVYVTPEGAYTIADRVKAWMIRHNVQQLPPNFEAIEIPVQIGDATQCALLIDELREMNPAFVILDTLAKCNLGRDENDAAAMGLFTDGMEKIARELDTFVLTIHHNNKNGGARGSVSIPANLDASVTMIASPGRVVTLHCDRVKGAPFDDFALIGRAVEIGETDKHGAPITSLVFESTETPAVAQADRTREKIFAALQNAGANGLTATEWQDKSEVGRSTLAEHRAALVDEKRVEWDGKIYKVAIMSAMSGNVRRGHGGHENYVRHVRQHVVPDVADIPTQKQSKPKRRAKNSADSEPYTVAPEVADESDGDLI
jgi:hypothetical protein